VKKIGLIAIAMVLALGTLGVGYALWSQQLTITGDTDTGTLTAGFKEILCVDMHQDAAGAFVLGEVEGKDVGTVVCTGMDLIIDPITAKQGYQTIDVVIDNAYPCYWVSIGFRVVNLGTVPLIVDKAVITDPTGELTWNPATQSLDNAAGEEILNFLFPNLLGVQIDPCDPLGSKAELDVHVKQPAIQGGHTYSFQMTLRAIQWNEYPQPDSGGP
jgi:hypothetical protein